MGDWNRTQLGVRSASFFLLCLVLSAAADAEERRPSEASDGTVILDTRSYWRVHAMLRPPVYGSREKPLSIKNVLGGRMRHAIIRNRFGRLPRSQPRSAPPAADWAQSGFDDSSWWRDPGPFFGGGPVRGNHFWYPSPHQDRYGISQPAGMTLLCLRGKFNVTGPARVKTLRMSAEFRGGMLVYLNGTEVARLFLPKGEVNFETLAEDPPVPPELEQKGLSRRERKDAPKKAGEAIVRQVSDVVLPTDALRKGANVLALEIHRSALDLHGGWKGALRSPVGLLAVRLSAAGDGAVPNTSRPKGVQVWNANVLEAVFPTDYGDSTAPPGPIRIVGTRNGLFSGKVVVGAEGGVRELKANMGPLRHKGNGASLPADAVAVRYGLLYGREDAPKTIRPMKNSIRFEALAETPTAKLLAPSGRRGRDPVEQPQPKTRPVWVTVQVPGDAAVGDYTGELVIKVNGGERVAVPVALHVHGFCLPEPKDYRTFVDFIQSPESLAIGYKVPLWSKRHFELIARSFQQLHRIGNKTLYIPLICKTNKGNSESMVRWIRRPDGTYEHDFTVMERYLDLALKEGIRPPIICLYVWDLHIGAAPGVSWGLGGGLRFGKEKREGRPSIPVPVTALDRQTGVVSEMQGPAYSDPGAAGFWKPVLAGIRQRLRARQLEKTVAFGVASDAIPRKETLGIWRKLAPDVQWISTSHHVPAKEGIARYRKRHGDQELPWHYQFGMSTCYSAVVMDFHPATDPEVNRTHGWSRPRRVAYFPRFQRKPAPAWNRLLFERAIQGDQHGAGHLAADFFPVLGTRALYARYPESSWRNLAMQSAWLAPGTDGPLSTIMFEMGVEGVQECEARIFIERALLDEALRAKLGEELAGRAQALLDERTRRIAWSDESVQNGRWFCFLEGGSLGYDWYAGSGWQERSAKLFEAAAQVQQKLREAITGQTKEGGE